MYKNYSINLLNVDKTSKAPSAAFSNERFHRRNLSPLKHLVQAAVTSTTYKWMTFIQHRPVDAVRLRTTWCFIVSPATAPRDVFQLSTTDLNIAYRNIHLHTTRKSGLHLRRNILKSKVESFTKNMWQTYSTTHSLAHISFSALMLLVWQQSWHPDYKKPDIPKTCCSNPQIVTQ